MTREQLAAMYLDWLNNWLTAEAWGEHYGLTSEEALQLLAVARSCANNPHPDN